MEYFANILLTLLLNFFLYESCYLVFLIMRKTKILALLVNLRFIILKINIIVFLNVVFSHKLLLLNLLLHSLQLCPLGTWGQHCLLNCKCQHGFGCDPVTGVCNCGPGFVGQFCEIGCSPDQQMFGLNCAYKLACVANQTNAADIVTGSCDCNAGYYGSTCNKKCDAGFYGYNCTNVCTCKNGAQCDPVSRNLTVI